LSAIKIWLHYVEMETRDRAAEIRDERRQGALRRATVSTLGAISQSWERATLTTGGFLTATLIGWFVEFLYGISSQATFLGALRVFCLLWFASGAAFFLGTMGGFLFGVPKARTGPLGPVSENEQLPATPLRAEISGYRDNTT
jgi:hypothetical protein